MEQDLFAGTSGCSSSNDEKNVFLLLSLPFNMPKQRYYPAAYVAGIIKNAGWQGYHSNILLNKLQICLISIQMIRMSLSHHILM